MKLVTKILLVILVCLIQSTGLSAQVRGIVIDAQTGDSLSFVNVYYTQRPGVGVRTKDDGTFALRQLEGYDRVSVSCVGYTTETFRIAKGEKFYTVRLKSNARELKTLVVKPKRIKYSRKNNPAVELMKKVIAAKKDNDLHKYDFFQYTRYQKQTLSLNDISEEKLDTGIYKKYRFMRDQVEFCKQTGKMILPVTVNEQVSKKIYRKDPESEKNIIQGSNSTGFSKLFRTGGILTTAMRDIFTDVDIYQNDIRLFQYRFVSPVSSTNAISFYRYFIMDTTYVDKDKCIHLTFVPNNPQDFGFTGHLYIKADSSYQIRKCILNLPKKSDVNWVTDMSVLQDFEVLPSGENVLVDDDMLAELSVYGLKLQVRKLTRYNEFTFNKIPNKEFKFKGKERTDSYAMMRDEAFWDRYRPEKLTSAESSTDDFFNKLSDIKFVRFAIFGVKALAENFVETGSRKTPSKVDIGPVNTIVSHNFVDGWRLRASAQTTANFNPHLFLRGYYAYGFKDHRNKGMAEVEYSINKKEYLAREFPKNSFTFNFMYDVQTPTDKFIPTDKDNVFTALKFTTVDQMMYTRRFFLKYEKEWEVGLKLTGQIKMQNDEPCGRLEYRPLTNPLNPVHDIDYTELMFGLRYAPGEVIINTKQRRYPMNLDAPVFTVTHQMGVKGFLGGEYNYNETEIGFFKRLWLPKSWGKFDTWIKAGAQWNKVPFPLLIVPAANLSYISEYETFNLINNMEFLNDRYVSLDMAWDLTGKIFNRIPLLRKLKWREAIGVKALWGKLTDKNNPYKNPMDSRLFLFPSYDGLGAHPRSFVMGSKPYVEVIAGIHNIFKLLHIEYVRCLTYLDLPTATKWGVRVRLMMTF